MAADLKDKVAFCVRIGARGTGELVVEWESGREGLGFRGPRQGVRGLRRLRRQTKGSRDFSEQGHQAKAQMNQSPPSEAEQSL